MTTAAAVASDKALAFVQEAYRDRSSEEQDAVEHPIAVARLLREDGQSSELVLAGLLHDLLEDTEVTAAELREHFGPGVVELVEALTQDPSIDDYRERKAALRDQIVAGGRDVATIALADKTAKLQAEQERPKERKLDHYRATLEQIEERYGESDLSRALRGQLARFPER